MRRLIETGCLHNLDAPLLGLLLAAFAAPPQAAAQQSPEAARLFEEQVKPRAGQIIGGAPDLSRRLTGPDSDRLTVKTEQGETNRELEASTSLRRIRGKAGPTPDYDLWAQGQWSHAALGSGWREQSLWNIGVDYRLSDKTVIGLLAHFDQADHHHGLAGQGFEADGWLIGPYLAARLHDNIILDGRVGHGGSTNLAALEQGVTLDGLETSRWLAQGKLTGDWRRGGWRFAPHVSAIYFSEQLLATGQNAGDRNANSPTAAPGLSFGQLSFGPSVSLEHKLSDEKRLTPTLGLTGLWEFDPLTNGAAARDAIAAPRLKLEAGMTLKETGGASLELGGYLDGLGAADARNYGARLQLRTPLD